MASALFTGSKHAMLYSKFRPSPPPDFIDSMIKYLQSKVSGELKQAVDIGCGTGQSTTVLAPHFEKIIGFDASEAQIESAKRNRSLPNVTYKVGDCSKLPLPDSSVHLVTSSQAVHWFDLPQFFTEVKRILVLNGVMAVYGYWIPMPQAQDEEQNVKIANLIDEDFHEKALGKYWHEGRNILKNYYRDIFFPFKDIQRLNLVIQTESSLADYIGYLSTWSAYQKLFEEDNEKAERLLKNVEKQLMIFLGQNKKAEDIVFPLHTDFFLMMGRS